MMIYEASFSDFLESLFWILLILLLSGFVLYVSFIYIFRFLLLRWQRRFFRNMQGRKFYEKSPEPEREIIGEYIDYEDVKD